MKKILGYLLPLALAAFLLWYTYKDQDLEKMFHDFGTARITPVILTMFTTLFAHYIRALRWNMLFEPLGYRPAASGSFLAVMSGYFANLLVPRAGELSRCTILSASDDIPVTTAIGTVLAERAFDMLMLLLIALAAFGLEFETLSTFFLRMQEKYGMKESTGSNLKLIFVVSLAIISVFALVFRKTLLQIPLVVKIMGMVKGLMEGLMSIGRLKNPGLFILYTLLIWACYYFTTYISLSMFSFTDDLGIKAAFMLLIAGSFGIVVPVPGAVGGPFQVFVSAALTQLYQKEETMSVTAASAMYWTQVIFSLGAGGLCYLLAILRANQKKKAAENV